MLSVLQSNRLEVLADALASTLREAPLAPFSAEVVIVPSAGLGRWLSFALADRLGIAANVRFVYAASYLWSLFARVLPDIESDSPFEPEPLTWRLFDALARDRRGPAFAPLRRYLADKPGDTPETRTLRRFDLAARIAAVFDGYLVQRPDWLERWGRGKLLGLGDDEGWQAALWREIAIALRVADKPHPRERFLAALDTDLTARAELPERLHLFALSALPPLYLDTFRRLGAYLPVNAFALNPAGLAYWGDIRKRAVAPAPQDEDTSSLGNALLASWGRHAQAFFDALVDAPSVERFAGPGLRSALAVLQSDVLDLRDRGGPDGETPPLTLSPDDRSLGFAVCHSATREVEALQDWLLDAFEGDPSLAPGDVVVLVPDLETYASAIGSVFGTAPEARRIPFAIADRGVARESAIARALLLLLSLPQSRLDAESVLALLDTDAAARRFSMSAEEVVSARRWVRESGIRWGRDGAARAALDLPASEEHTWRHGLDRMLLGLALPEEGPALFRGRLPYDQLEGTDARLLGALAGFADAVFALEDALRAPRSPGEWRALLEDALERFFAPALEEHEELGLLRHALARFAENARIGDCETPIPLAVVRRALDALLAPAARTEAFLAGGVTFAALLPNRPLASRIVVLLGMNDGAFPPQARPPSFDLSVRHPRRGDRIVRDEARYAALDALLGARDRLYVSWTGRSVRDNTPKPPSVVVSELRDVVARSFHAEGDDGDILARLTVEHPLQAFSRKYFERRHDDDRKSAPALWSFSEQYAQAGRAAALSPSRPQPRFFDATLAPAPLTERELPLATFIRGLQNPARRLLRDRLGLALREGEGVIESAEPFALNALEAWQLREETYRLLVGGASREEAAALARARGRLPHGAMGDAAFHVVLGDVMPVANAVRSAAARDGAPPLPFAFDLGPVLLQGVLEGRYAHGLVIGHPGKARARHILAAWITHLVFHLVDAKRSHATELHALGEAIELKPVKDPAGHLHALAQLWIRAASRPVPFFPETSWMYAKAVADGAGEPLALARKCFEPRDDGNSITERAEPHVELAFRGVEDPLDEEFTALALEVFMPLLDNLEKRA